MLGVRLGLEMRVWGFSGAGVGKGGVVGWLWVHTIVRKSMPNMISHLILDYMGAPHCEIHKSFHISCSKGQKVWAFRAKGWKILQRVRFETRCGAEVGLQVRTLTGHSGYWSRMSRPAC